MITKQQIGRTRRRTSRREYTKEEMDNWLRMISEVSKKGTERMNKLREEIENKKENNND